VFEGGHPKWKSEVKKWIYAPKNTNAWSFSLLTAPSVRLSSNHDISRHVREKALVICALVEFVCRIHAAHRVQIVKDDLVGADSDDWTIHVEKLLDDFALFQPEHVRGKPKVGDCRIPRARDTAKRGEEEIVDGASEEVDGGSEEKGGNGNSVREHY
jgi:hypothetical protein